MEPVVKRSPPRGKVLRFILLWAPIVALVALCMLPLIMALRVDKYNPPPSLQRSAEKVIQSIYPVLDGSEDVEKLYSLLEPGVHVYYLFGPRTDHPAHKKGEYEVNLVQLRWHCTVYPAKREADAGQIREIWIVHLGGQGRWYGVLRQHRYYFFTVASGVWSERRVVKRSDIVFEREGTPASVEFD